MNPSSIAVPVHHHFYNVYIRCATTERAATASTPLFPEMTCLPDWTGEGDRDDELVSGVQRQKMA